MHLFVYLLDILIFYFVTCLSKYYGHFSIGLFVFFLSVIRSSSCTLDTNSLLVIKLQISFLQSVAFFCLAFDIFYHTQILLYRAVQYISIFLYNQYFLKEILPYVKVTTIVSYIFCCVFLVYVYAFRSAMNVEYMCLVKDRDLTSYSL